MASVGVVASIIILFDSAVKGALCVIVGECIVAICCGGRYWEMCLSWSEV